MKIYVLQTLNVDDKGNFIITFHRQLFSTKQQAFEAAHKMGPDTSVLSFENTYIWTPELIRDQLGISE